MLFFSSLAMGFVLSAIARAASVSSPEAFAYGPTDWQAKWDSWPTIHESAFKNRMFSRNDPVGLINNSTLIDPAEVCARVVGCVGTAVGIASDWTTAAAYATQSACSTAANYAANAIAANNYQLAQQIANFIVVEIAVPLALSIPMYYINVALQNDAPQSQDDTCGVDQAQAIAEQAGTVTYGWCLQLQEITSDEAFSRIDLGTVSSQDESDDVGLDMKARLFLSRTQGQFAQACQLLGVWLKRALA